jgi:glycosyltransferase involved in cell wall biosynthesis
MPDISVIVCTHNPKPEYMHRVLDGLRLQTLPRSHWDLIMVDNGSRGRLSDSWDLSWHEQARHLREDAIGLTHARSRGISEASGDLLVFVDDDNVVAPDYLEQAWAIHRKNPHLGVFGAGMLEPAFETEPPTAIKIHLGMLALRSVSSNLWSNNIKDSDVIPWGAGLCVTRGLARFYQQFLESLDTHITAVLGRRGKELFTGDDNVFSWIAVSVGLGFGIFPALRVTHLISRSRVAPAHVVKLIGAHTLSSDVLHYSLAGTEPHRGGWLTHVRLILHALRNGWFSAHCQWAALSAHARASRFIAAHQLEPTRIAGAVASGLEMPGKPTTAIRTS